MRVFLGSGWYFLAAGGLLLAIFAKAAGSSSRLPRPVRVLRLAAAALTVILLARPYAVLYRSAPEPPRLAVLLDASVHMREGHTSRGAARTKYAEASAWLGKNLPGLGDSAAMECYVFSDRLYRTDCSSFTVSGLAGGYAESDLRGALSALGGEGPASCPDRVWIFTDGLSLSGGAAAPVPDGCGSRADIVSVGAVSPPRGVSLTGLSGPPFAFAHIPFQISGSARVSGLKGSRLRLKLMDGTGAVAGTRTLRVATDDEVVTATFSVSARSVGRADYSFCAVAGPGEGCSAVKPLTVSVIREKLRVMYLAGRPSFEYAFLRDLLKGRSGVDLVSFVILRDPEDMPATDERELSLIPFPVNEIFLRDISHFDVFIMQDFDLRRFSVSGNYIASLADFVRRGGGLAVLGGRSSFGGGGYYGMPDLEAMLPAGAGTQPDFSGELEYRVSPSGHAAARLFPFQENDERFWSGAPSLKGASLLGPLKPGARAVFHYEDPVSGDKRVFSAERVYGKGRVMAIAGTSTWRWKMLGARQTRHSGLYSAFWSRTLAYLDGSLGLEKVTLDPLPRSGPGRLFRLKVLNDDHLPPSEGDPVSVDAYLEAGGRTAPVEFTRSGRGLYEASVQPAAPGRNRLRASVKLGGEYLGSAESVFEAGGAPEFSPSDEAALERLAASSGGGYYRLDRETDAGRLAAKLPPAGKGRREASRFAPDGSLAVMLLAAGLFMAGWIAGRLKGLP